MFSKKRRMPPIARRRKAQLTIPSKFWKPELDKTYQKLVSIGLTAFDRIKSNIFENSSYN